MPPLSVCPAAAASTLYSQVTRCAVMMNRYAADMAPVFGVSTHYGSFSCARPRCRLRVDERCDAVAAGPIWLESLSIHPTSWQRHHCSAHLGLMLLHAAKAPLPRMIANLHSLRLTQP